MKICSKCGEEKSADQFALNGRKRDGTPGARRPECKQCQTAQEKARDSSHRPSRQRSYKQAERMRRVFGITLHEYEAMFAAQGGRCAICRNECAYNRRDTQPLVIDHDHVTGRVRGLLCHHCNGMLGWARDNPDVLAAAIKYLRVEVHQHDDADVQDVLDRMEDDAEAR